MNRRRFIHTLGWASAGAAITPSRLLAARPVHLVILHTNDTHSRMDPFPENAGRMQGLGGVARRASLIKQVRRTEEHVLLLDSGDIFQGTPYFNFFGGEVELEAMTAMGYDLATLGNHDFDNGVGGLVDVLPHAGFDFVSANYSIDNPDLAARVTPYSIRDVGGARVGIFGLGIELEGLVPAVLHEGVSYEDPLHAASRTVEALKNEGCDLVVCLSHLGYRYRHDKVSDVALANEVEGIDLILGGHTHTFLDEPDVVRRFGGGETQITQVGWGGVRLGRVDVFIDPERSEQPRMMFGGYPIDERRDVA